LNGTPLSLVAVDRTTSLIANFARGPLNGMSSPLNGERN
jgi:hypothetical protein